MNKEILIKQQESIFRGDLVPPEPKPKDYSIVCSLENKDMIAYVRIITDKETCGVSEFDLLSRLYAEGVTENINFERISEMVAMRRYNEKVVAAAGFQPERGSDALLIPQIELKEFPPDDTPQAAGFKGVPVEMDQVLMVKQPATTGKPGISLRGRKSDPEPGKDMDFKFGANVFVYKDGLKLVSSIPGMAGLANGRVEVRDPDYDVWKYKIYTKQNKMQALLAITPGHSRQPEHTETWFDELMNEHGLKFGVDRTIIKRLPERITTTLVLTVARGEMPIAGKYALIMEHYREGAVPGQALFKVAKDQLIAEKIPAGAGVRGRNVFDEAAPAPDGNDIDIKTGPGCRLSEDGLRVLADDDGYVSRTGNTFSIAPCLELDTTKKPGVHKINFDGMVSVVGDLLQGSAIVAGRHVEIQGSVDGAEIIAGGDLCVRGVVRNCINTRIQSGGDMSLGGAERARVNAGGAIRLGGPARDCDLMAGAGVFSLNGGASSIAGGRVITPGGLDVLSLGAPGGASTVIFAGVPQDLRSRYDYAAQQLSLLINRLGVVAKEMFKLMQLIKEKRTSLDDVVKFKKVKYTHDTIKERIKRDKAIVARLQARLIETSRNTAIIVNKNVFPGVLIKIGPFSHRTQKPLKRCIFSPNTATQSLTVKEFE